MFGMIRNSTDCVMFVFRRSRKTYFNFASDALRNVRNTKDNNFSQVARCFFLNNKITKNANNYTENLTDEMPMKHKKKKNQVSKSSKRSDHKHQYEKILIKSFFWLWGERCTVCGRINTKTTFSKSDFATQNGTDDDKRYYRELSLDEIKKKFVGVPIYSLDFGPDFKGDGKYMHVCTSLKYNDFYGVYKFSEEDNCYYGKIDFITDLVSFESDTPEGIETAFKEAVDDYIEVCQSIKTQKGCK